MLQAWARSSVAPVPDEPSLWRHGDFLRLWGAQSISALGSQVTILALPLTAILALHASAAEVALLFTATTLPSLVLGLPAGALVDRVQRRTVMIAADVGRAALLASVPLAYALGILSLPQLYVVAMAGGSLSVLFEIASQAYLPAVVSRTSLVEANAKLEGSRVVAQAAGPGTGGGLVSLATAPVAVLADAASFVVSALLIRSASRQDEQPVDAVTPSRLREGARFVLGHAYLRPLLLAHALANVALGLVWSIAIVYAVRELGLSAGVVGAVLSVGQIGGLTGAAFARRVAGRFGVGRVLATAFFLFGPATLLIALAPRGAAIAFLTLGWVVENLGRALYGVCATSVRQALVPDRLQARVTGFQTTVGTGAFPLGTAAGSALAGLVGLRTAMLAGALIAFVPFLPVVASPLRSLRDLPHSVDER